MATAPKKMAYVEAGPERLATENAVAPIDSPREDLQWRTLYNHLNGRLNQLRAWRYSWMMHFRELEDFILPRRGTFINSSMPTPNTMVRGIPINQNIIDPTGTQAMRICAAGLMSGMLSPSRPWFKLKPALVKQDKVPDDVEAWCEKVSDIMQYIMAKSNFYDSAAQMFEDLTVFGTGPMLIYEDEKDIVRCQVPCPGEYFLGASNSNRVEAFYRMFVATVSQIVEMFGLENCPQDIQKLWQAKGPSLEIEKVIAHAIEPNFAVHGASGDGLVPGHFPWREAYWVWGSSNIKPLALGGFYEPPFVAPRWATTSNDAYGRSVGMDCLADIKELQFLRKRLAEAIEKQVRPPMMADISMKNEPSSILPGHVTYVSGISAEKGMRPIFTVQPDIRGMTEEMEKLRARIKTGFFNDLFLMHAETTKEQTAYEASQRQMEKLQVLGPVIERLQGELLQPVIHRIFEIMRRKDLLPDMPASMAGVPLDIEYVSMMVLAQRASSTAAIERYAQISQQLSQQFPEAHFALDVPEMMNLYAEELGVPHRIVRDPDQIKKLMDQQQKAAAAQQQHQQMMDTLTQGSKAAANLGSVSVGGGQSAIQAMLGGAADGSVGGGMGG